MADYTWTDPKIFAETNNVNSVVLNRYLSENMRYLFKRPRDIVTLRDVGIYTTTSTSFVAIDTDALRLNITLQTQADLNFWVNTAMSNTNSGATWTLDILMDGTTYLSSGTGTPLNRGLALSNAGGANYNDMVGLNYIEEDVSAGLHFFDLYWKVNSGTGTLDTTSATQFGGIEV